MAYQVETHGLEEHQHPFYVIRFAIKRDNEEILSSVARYVHTQQGGSVQFLEPDMKKLQRLPDGMKQIDEVEHVIKKEGARWVKELRGE
jgi:hypothetical protein